MSDRLPPPTYTSDQVAQALEISVEWVRRLAREENIGTKTGRIRYFSAADVDRLKTHLDAQRQRKADRDHARTVRQRKAELPEGVLDLGRTPEGVLVQLVKLQEGAYGVLRPGALTPGVYKTEEEARAAFDRLVQV